MTELGRRTGLRSFSHSDYARLASLDAGDRILPTERYYFDDGKSRKFWSINRRGKSLSTASGRLGTEGRKTNKVYETAAECAAAAKTLIGDKTRKGYVKVDPTLLKLAKFEGVRKATESQVANLERRLEAKLPNEYRAFLLAHNGGRPENGSIEVFGRTWDRYRYIACVDPIYTLQKGAPPYFSLYHAIQTTLPLVPPGHLPTADSGGNLITIDLKTKIGCIYYFDHEHPELEDEEEDVNGIVRYKLKHATLLAGTFNELLTRIAVFEDED